MAEGLAYVYNVYKSPCPPSPDPINGPVTFEGVLLNDILIAPRWWGRARKIRAEGVKSAATVAMPTSVNIYSVTKIVFFLTIIRE